MEGISARLPFSICAMRFAEFRRLGRERALELARKADIMVVVGCEVDEGEVLRGKEILKAIAGGRAAEFYPKRVLLVTYNNRRERTWLGACERETRG